VGKVPKFVGNFLDGVITHIQVPDEIGKECGEAHPAKIAHAKMSDDDRVIGDRKEFLKVVIDSGNRAMGPCGGSSVGGNDHIVWTD
jgi:hypothetical protein